MHRLQLERQLDGQRMNEGKESPLTCTDVQALIGSALL